MTKGGVTLMVNLVFPTFNGLAAAAALAGTAGFAGVAGFGFVCACTNCNVATAINTKICFFIILIILFLKDRCGSKNTLCI